VCRQPGARNASEWALTAENARLIRRTVATNLRRERVIAGLTQRDLAERSTVGIATVVRLEGSRTESNVPTLMALSFGLYIPMASLLIGVPGPELTRDSLTFDTSHTNGGLKITAQRVREILGANLRRARAHAGLSQRALSVRSHIGEDAIVRIEGARQDARLGTLVTLSFGVQADLLSLLVGIPNLTIASNGGDGCS
jgi:transcriptional regulator with XRE-family HTH domain